MKLEDAKPGDVVTSSRWGDHIYIVIDVSFFRPQLEQRGKVYLMSLDQFKLMTGDAETEVTIVNPEETK